MTTSLSLNFYCKTFSCTNNRDCNIYFTIKCGFEIFSFLSVITNSYNVIDFKIDLIKLNFIIFIEKNVLYV